MIEIYDFGANLIIDKLTEHGYQAYYVGGCVRDAVMGVKVNDYDITTNCLPEKVIEIFSDFTIFTAGLKHGTVSVVINHAVYEITTFRIECGYSDKRRPDCVEFCNNLIEDLSRRDFTCNALAFNKKQGLIDNFKGFYDIQNKTLRSVGCANKRFNEDALRILRAVRFCSKLSFEVEPITKREAIKNAKLLNNVSKERIFEELKGIILGKNCTVALREFKPVIESVIPEFKRVGETEYYGLTSGIALCVSFYAKLSIFLSAFTVDEVKSILKKLKSDNKIILAVMTLLSNKNTEFTSKPQIKRLMNATISDLSDFFDLQRALAVINNDNKKLTLVNNGRLIVDEIIKNNECFTLKQLGVNGNDLLQLGYKEHEIGKSLNFLLQAVIDEKIDNDREKLIDYLNKNFYD